MYYINGAWVETGVPAIHPEDRGYQFGDGIYEVIRIYQGKLYQWEGHMARLVRSAKELELTLPFSPEELKLIANQLIQKNGIGENDDAILYLQITRGAAPRQFEFPEPEIKPVFTAYVRLKERPLQLMQTGIKVITVPDIRWLRCDIKSLNLLGAVLAKQKAKSAGADDCVQHRDGIVTEGSSSNVFVVKNGVLHTHPATNLILHGITRHTVLELAHSLQIPVVEESFHLDFLRAADEIFFTSTTLEIMPAVSLDGQAVGTGEAGPVVRKLQEAFQQYISTPGQTLV